MKAQKRKSKQEKEDLVEGSADRATLVILDVLHTEVLGLGIWKLPNSAQLGKKQRRDISLALGSIKQSATLKKRIIRQEEDDKK